MAKHPKILKIISAAMLCFCALALGKERQKGRITMTGIGYALLLGGGISNFIDRMKMGSVTDYVRFPKFPVKKISELVFNLSDFGIFAGVFCLLFRKKQGKGRAIPKVQAGMILYIISPKAEKRNCKKKSKRSIKSENKHEVIG